MACVTIILALLAMVTGIRAALLWRDSAESVPRPYILPDDETTKNALWIEQFRESLEKTAKLNRRAAYWTASSVILSAFATFSGM